MAQLVAGLYEIRERIGSGGGGVVYLGRHTRLDKAIVLKADRRKLSASGSALRREVDLLKGLGHQYLPQVYDFVQEGDMVYTVMDYVEGESLDKILKRGQKPPQSLVIRWACQLLDALHYLHTRPPYGILHADIKPANIMLRPDGNICLIDFNIALALGENGAVRVGFSKGYASPEHYGLAYVSGERGIVLISTSIQDASQRAVPAAAPAAFPNAGGGQKPQQGPGGRGPQAAGGGASQGGPWPGGEETIDMGRQGQPSSSPGRAGTASIFPQASPPASPAVPSAHGGGSGSASGSREYVLLDVRSDIYSLGATLYHLISGIRPPEAATDVRALGPEVCSPAVAAILQKAMQPVREERYQSAEEMLQAFLDLYKKDKRTIRRKWRIRASTAALSALFLAGGAMAFVGLKRQEQHKNALALSEYSADALAEGDVREAIRLALEAIPAHPGILDAPVTAEAQKALTDALGVYELSDRFQAADSIKLPSAPFQIVASPEGTRFAAVYAYAVSVYDAGSTEPAAVLPTQKSALSDALFLDEDTVIYAGEAGVTSYSLPKGEVLWQASPATTLALSGDGAVLAAVDRDADGYTLYDAHDGRKLLEGSFYGQHLEVPYNDTFGRPDGRIFALNEDGTRLAASFSNGALWVFCPENPAMDLICYEASAYHHFEGGFLGELFCYVASESGSKTEKPVLEIMDWKAERGVAGADAEDAMHLQIQKGGIYLSSGNTLTILDPYQLEEEEVAYLEEKRIAAFSVGEGYTFLSTEDNGFSFFDSGAHLSSAGMGNYLADFPCMLDRYAVLGSKDEATLRAFRLSDHRESDIFSYDARYVHTEARISQDGRTAMLFSKDGFRVYGQDGAMLAEEAMPEADRIYDQQFRRTESGSYLEVTWYDGTIRHYDAADGALIHTGSSAPPDQDLQEEFDTEKYHIIAPMHDAPEVYDARTGQRIASLRADAYLAYITEVSPYIIADYTSFSDGENARFAVLMNQDLEELALLPALCDVHDGKLVFDYGSGELRECPLYSLGELLEMGGDRLKG